MIDVAVSTREFEGMGSEEFAALQSQFDVRSCGASIAGCREMGSIVGQYCVDLVWNGCDELTEEIGRDLSCRLLDELYKSELGGAINRNEKIELPLLGSHLGEVDMKVANGIRLELLLRERAMSVELKQLRPATVPCGI